MECRWRNILHASYNQANLNQLLHLSLFYALKSKSQIGTNRFHKEQTKQTNGFPRFKSIMAMIYIWLSTFKDLKENKQIETFNLPDWTKVAPKKQTYTSKNYCIAHVYLSNRLKDKKDHDNIIKNKNTLDLTWLGEHSKSELTRRKI